MTLNTLYKRNSDPGIFYGATTLGTLNCGSFALDVDKWYCPYIENDDEIGEDDYLWRFEEYERECWIIDMLEDEIDRLDVMEAVIDRDFEFILKTCPWLEQIDEDEIDLKDRVVAYRLSMMVPSEASEFDVDSDMDFHFRVLIDGEWWEKNGNGPVHKVEDPEADVWEVEDWLVYDGPIRYARFKEEV